MPEYKTTAIVLRTYDLKDYDKIVVLYSRERGLIRAVAKNVKRHKSLLKGRIEPMTASEFIIFEGRNLDSISQADITETFKNLRKDFNKITFGLYFCELSSAFGLENDPQSESFYEFLFESLKKLECADETTMIENLLVAFEYNIIAIAGYAPVFNICGSCRTKIHMGDDLLFSANMGMAICKRCNPKNSSLIEINLNLYKYLLGLADKSISLSNLELSTVTKAHNLLFDYITTKTNYKLKTPKLIDSICLS